MTTLISPNIDQVPLRVVIATPEVLKQILECKTLGPCTVLAVAQKPQPPPISLLVQSRCQDSSPVVPRHLRRLLVLDGLSNAENVGSLIRTASCFGVEAVVLSKNCCTCWSRRAIRVSMGHCFKIPVFVEGEGAGVGCGEGGEQEGVKTTSLEEIFSLWKRSSPSAKSYAAVVQGETRFLHEVEREDLMSLSSADHLHDPEKQSAYLLVMGAEQEGVSPRVRALCDEQLKIWMAPGNDSLNVGMACGIILQHFATQGLAGATRGLAGRGN